MLLAKTRYTRHELEMYIGVENVDDFDVDAIEQEVSTWDAELGCSVWTVEGEELARACYRHQIPHLPIVDMEYGDLVIRCANHEVFNRKRFCVGNYVVAYTIPEYDYIAVRKVCYTSSEAKREALVLCGLLDEMWHDVYEVHIWRVVQTA